MTRVYPTATLRHLAQRRRLPLALEQLAPASPEWIEPLRHLLNASDGLDPDVFDSENLARLEEGFLVEREDHPLPRPGLPFAFVEAINFEFTYGCNLACKHCLQDSLRPPGKIRWMNREAVARALDDGALLGLTRRGVNFTGGETHLPGSPILDLIDHAARLGLRIRSNTNAWWGKRSNFRVGDREFATDEALVAHLKSAGLTRMALSMDSRYHQYPDLLDRVIRVATLCEDAELTYEVVATDAPDEILADFERRLHRAIGRQPRYLMITPMEMVDIGAAAGGSSDAFEPAHLAPSTEQSPCQGKGFYRPCFLHVNPDGGLRSCLYAPGATVLGDLTKERFPEIINRADANPVIRLFADGHLDEFVEERITPWKHLYREVRHPCSASALIARVASALHQHESTVERRSTDLEATGIHRRIAAEMNLTANPCPGKD